MAVNNEMTTEQITEWQSIVTLLVFVVANIIVLFPFKIPVYFPRSFWNIILDTLDTWRIVSTKETRRQDGSRSENSNQGGHDDKVKPWVRLNFPMNFVTVPLLGDLFLLAILAIGRDEVKGGTIGSDNISPIDIMGFFITLAYIAISIDASGLIRYLAFRVLQKGGKSGRKLFFYLYAFFFALGSFIGNDPIILSGTAFLAYMTRVSSNIAHPRAWIYTQFAVANIASAILVSSNPTNLVLAGAFGIKFVEYTANIIVPVIATVVVLFPFLLFVVFADETLIPRSITMHELPDEAKAKKPVNPNIPNGRRAAGAEEALSAANDHEQILHLEEILNPFLDKGGATVGAVIMAATLITVLAINAASQRGGQHPVSYVTVPAAFVMLCWDLSLGWFHRDETREIARRGREEVERARAERLKKEEREARRASTSHATGPLLKKESRCLCEKASESGLAVANADNPTATNIDNAGARVRGNQNNAGHFVSTLIPEDDCPSSSSVRSALQEKQESVQAEMPTRPSPRERLEAPRIRQTDENWRPRVTLASLVSHAYRWFQETFPTVNAVLVHLPLTLVPFTFAMFVLVQALVTKGWIQVFAYGWDHWVQKTGTVGGIGGMAFLSVILCNFSGTNIGTTILLSRVIQTWVRIHEGEGTFITNRTFWGTVYAMAIGVNYGAFSTAFSASLAGLLWRDILARKHIHVRRLEFARVNLPIVAVSMTVACAVLVGEVYIMRDELEYKPSWETEHPVS